MWVLWIDCKLSLDKVACFDGVPIETNILDRSGIQYQMGYWSTHNSQFIHW